MIYVDRILSLSEYETANKLTLRYGTWRQRLNYHLYLWVFPILGIPILICCVWRGIQVFQLPGDHGSQFGILCGVAWLGIWFPLQPWFLRRKIKKLYQKQSFDRTWRLELDDANIRSAIEGLAESKMEWQYFDRFVSTPELYVVIRSVRPLFISIPRSLLTAAQDEELNSLLRRHLSKAN